MCVIPPTPPTPPPTPTINKFQRLRERSFCVNVQRLFNGLPSDLTGVTQIDFKNELDRFLWTVADKPLVREFILLVKSPSKHDSAYTSVNLLLVTGTLVLCITGYPSTTLDIYFPKLFISIRIGISFHPCLLPSAALTDDWSID